jgi:hypothetical protein
MIASGLPVSAIADKLALSVKTISMYRARLLKKMQLKNNAELTHYAIKQGFRLELQGRKLLLKTCSCLLKYRVFPALSAFTLPLPPTMRDSEAQQAGAQKWLNPPSISIC